MLFRLVYIGPDTPDVCFEIGMETKPSMKVCGPKMMNPDQPPKCLLKEGRSKTQGAAKVDFNPLIPFQGRNEQILTKFLA